MLTTEQRAELTELRSCIGQCVDVEHLSNNEHAHMEELRELGLVALNFRLTAAGKAALAREEVPNA